MNVAQNHPSSVSSPKRHRRPEWSLVHFSGISSPWTKEHSSRFSRLKLKRVRPRVLALRVFSVSLPLSNSYLLHNGGGLSISRLKDVGKRVRQRNSVEQSHSHSCYDIVYFKRTCPFTVCRDKTGVWLVKRTFFWQPNWSKESFSAIWLVRLTFFGSPIGLSDIFGNLIGQKTFFCNPIGQKSIFWLVTADLDRTTIRLTQVSLLHTIGVLIYCSVRIRSL